MSSSSKLFPLISKLYIVLLVISESFGVPDNPDLQIELKSSSSSATSIPSCEAEIRRICGKKENFNDLDALDCILNQKVSLKSLIEDEVSCRIIPACSDSVGVTDFYFHFSEG